MKEKELHDIQELKNFNDSRKFFQKVNKGRKPFKPRLSACRSDNGELLTEKVKILERWCLHFCELLSGEVDETNEYAVRRD